jgi:hypothetical protein
MKEASGDCEALTQAATDFKQANLAEFKDGKLPLPGHLERIDLRGCGK